MMDRRRRIEGAEIASSRQCCVLLAASLVLLVPSFTPIALASQRVQNPHPFHSIPLVSHHTVRQRHLTAISEETSTHSKHSRNSADRPHYSRHDARWLQETTSHVTPQSVAALYQGYGTHYADIWCGTPTPQRQTVIVDTGSGVTAFPCAGCADGCGAPKYHIDELYDGANTSNDYTVLKCTECLHGTCDGARDECHMGMSYAEGSSWKAVEVSDRCFVGGPHQLATMDSGAGDSAAAHDDLNPIVASALAFDLKFGCQSSVTGLFKTQLADGIMGMDVAPAAFWWQLWDANKIPSKAFSLCFSRSDTAARSGTVAGALSLGGTDERLHGTTMVYTKPPARAGSGRGFYVVHVRAMWLRAGGAGTSAVPTDPQVAMYKLDISEDRLNRGNVIVDSGTTGTFRCLLPSRTFPCLAATNPFCLRSQTHTLLV